MTLCFFFRPVSAHRRRGGTLYLQSGQAGGTGRPQGPGGHQRPAGPAPGGNRRKRHPDLPPAGLAPDGGAVPGAKAGAGPLSTVGPCWAQKPDFCLINTRFYLSSLYAGRACRRRKIPAIIVEHSTGHLPMGGGLPGLAGHCYEHLACWYLRQYCTRFFGVSQAVCRWLEHFGIPAEHLSNAVDPAELEEILAGASP